MFFLSIHPRCPKILFKSEFLLVILDNLLRTYCVPDSAPGMGDMEVKKLQEISGFKRLPPTVGTQAYRSHCIFDDEG